MFPKEDSSAQGLIYSHFHRAGGGGGNGTSGEHLSSGSIHTLSILPAPRQGAGAFPSSVLKARIAQYGSHWPHVALQ